MHYATVNVSKFVHMTLLSANKRRQHRTSTHKCLFQEADEVEAMISDMADEYRIWIET